MEQGYVFIIRFTEWILMEGVAFTYFISMFGLKGFHNNREPRGQNIPATK